MPYGDPGDTGPASARAALTLALSVLLRLLAPILPFVTEEVWSWWQAGSIHNAPWPGAAEFGAVAPEGPVGGPSPTGASVLDVAADVLGQVRRAKTTAKRSMRSPVARLTVTDTAPRIDALRSAEDDVRDAGGVIDFDTAVGDEFAVDVELGEEDCTGQVR